MQGTLINAGAVVAGSLLGLMLNKKMPKRISSIAFQGIGLFTLFLGVKMACEAKQILLMIFSIVSGSILGELIDIDKYLSKFSEFLRHKLKSSNTKFSEGLITSFILFCVGSLTILGAIEEGLGNEPTLLMAKSVLDGFSSIALASTLGIGVLFSAIPLLIFQGSITVFAGILQNFLNEAVVTELSAVGGLLLIGLSLTLLDIKKIKVTNMLPSLIIIVVLAYFFQ